MIIYLFKSHRADANADELLWLVIFFLKNVTFTTLVHFNSRYKNNFSFDGHYSYIESQVYLFYTYIHIVHW